MKLLVTGGMGFIGSNFIRHSIDNHQYESIINIDSLSYGSNPANLKDLEKNDKYTFIKGNISDSSLVNDYAKEVNAIVNFAAESHVDRSIANPEPFIQSNVIGTYMLLEAARVNDVDLFLQVSTDEIYGEAESNRSFNETDLLRPSNPYSATKASSDHLVSAYYKTYGLRCIITRCTNNFGPYQFPEKLIPKSIIRALKGLKVPIYGDGSQIRSWIYVLDHVEALNLVLRNGKAGEIYNLTTWNEMTNREIVTKVLSIMRKSPDMIQNVEDRPGHDTRYSVDSSKIQEQLGWKARYQFEQALQETVNWYVKNQPWWEPLADERTLHPTPWKLKW
ncbi:MAG: dTDP-glucose 4,6-dehydratase [Nitrososphaerales archaeon]